MKRDLNFAVKTVATAALIGNISADVVKRMVMYITDETTDSNVICSLLNGMVVDAKINNKEKLAEIISKYANENICEVKEVETIVHDQTIRITYICRRFAKSNDETRVYNTSRRKDETYTEEVKVQDAYRLDINSVNWENSLEFEIV